MIVHFSWSSLIPPPPVAWSPWSSWQVIPIKAQKIFMKLIWHDSLEDISGYSKVCQTHATQNSEHLQPLKDPGKDFFSHTYTPLERWQKTTSLPTTNHHRHHQSPATTTASGLTSLRHWCLGRNAMANLSWGAGSCVVGCSEGWLVGPILPWWGVVAAAVFFVFTVNFCFFPEISLLNILRHRILVQIEIDFFLLFLQQKKAWFSGKWRLVFESLTTIWRDARILHWTSFKRYIFFCFFGVVGIVLP